MPFGTAIYYSKCRQACQGIFDGYRRFFRHWGGIFPARCQDFLQTAPATTKPLPDSAGVCGGKKGIRTLEGFRGPTRFPVVRLRPAQPSFQSSRQAARVIIAIHTRLVKPKRTKNPIFWRVRLRPCRAFKGWCRGSQSRPAHRWWPGPAPGLWRAWRRRTRQRWPGCTGSGKTARCPASAYTAGTSR